MRISDQTVLKFIEAHKPQRIDVPYMIDKLEVSLA